MTGIGESVAFATIGLVLLGSGLASSLVKRTFHSVIFLGVALVAAAALYILLGSPLVGVLQVLVYVGGILTLFIFAVMFVSGDETELDAPEPPPARAWPLPVILAASALGVAVFVLVVAGAAAALSAGLSSVLGVAGSFLATLLLLAVSAVALAIVLVPSFFLVRAVFNRRWNVALGVAVASVAFALVAQGAGTSFGASNAGGAGDSDAQLDAITIGLFDTHVMGLQVLGVLLTAALIGAMVIARPLGGRPDKESYGHVTAEQLAEAQRVSDVAARMPEAGR